MKIETKNKKVGLKFDEKEHKYFVGSNEIPSVTQIINTVFGNPFELNTEAMVAARDKGTLIHKSINHFLVTGHIPDFDMVEFNNFLRISSKRSYTWDMSEQMIYNSVEGFCYAGTLDLYDSKKKEISDVKTGSVKAVKKWQIQLSLYAWALRDTYGLEVERASILWLHDETAEYITISILDKVDCVSFLKKYYCPKQAEDVSLKCLDESAIAKLETGLEAIERIQAEIDEYKKQIKEEMEQRGLLQIKIGKRTVSYVAPATRESLDTKKLKENLPDVYEAYKKVSKVAGSIRIK